MPAGSGPAADRALGGPPARPGLLRKLARLRTLEWANVLWVGWVLLWVLPARSGAEMPGETWQRTLAYLPVAALLVVGGWYWHRKHQQLAGRRGIDDALAVLDRLDAWLRWLVVAATVGVVASWVARVGSTADRAWASGLVAFAWLEYVNYFRVQLMHDTRSDLRRLWRTRRLRPSWLASDLADRRRRRGR